MSNSSAADFKVRKKWAEADNNVFRLPSIDCEYIPVHPFSDELSFLRKHKFKPSQCYAVDAYCKIGQVFIFMRVLSLKNSFIKSGNYANRRKGKYPVHLSSIVKSSQISRRIFESRLKGFVKAQVLDKLELLDDDLIEIKSLGTPTPKRAAFKAVRSKA